jgi:hypothetical protein
MKNIHVLPTEQPSRIYLIKSNNKLGITSNNPEFTENFGSGTQNQNLFITSDEEIKEGDFFYSVRGVIEKAIINYPKGEHFGKLILTTDQNLIKDSVQAIDDEFLEWFVKNPSCEWVWIQEKQHFEADKSKRKNPLNGVYYSYKIIIPKEEPKQLTDLEIAIKLEEIKREEPKQQSAVEWLVNEANLLENNGWILPLIEQAKEMEKEQQGYSEEEVIKLLISCKDRFGGSGLEDYTSDSEIIEWFEQFKNK